MNRSLDTFLLKNKFYSEPSVFIPENLLRESRRQKELNHENVPDYCVLDPDGDIVKYLRKTNKAKKDNHWACYHTDLYRFKIDDIEIGIIGNAVGASFSVLVAEQLFVSGCKLLLSITSAGIINPPDKKFILIKSAIRDEGTSYHYLPGDRPAIINSEVLNSLLLLTKNKELSLGIGDSWTTDAPYRETKSSIDFIKSLGVISVEMESAALYSYAIALDRKVVCFAHMTNSMAQNEVDFEKGIENGSVDSLSLIKHAIDLLKE